MTPSSAILGVDFGSTTISGGLVTREGEILGMVQHATHGNGPGTAVDTLLAVIGELNEEARTRSIAVVGVGVGVPGIVDPEKGMVAEVPGHWVPELARVPLVEGIHAKIGLPVFVDNDVNALALGELAFGLGRGTDSLVVLAVGTGVGGGIILGGVLVRGERGSGGEFGHVTVKLDGRPCMCGSRGCLDAYVGGRQLAARGRAEVGGRPESLVLALAGGDRLAITAEMIFEAAGRGDALARSIVEEACEALGAGLAQIVNALNPRVIVVTGGVATSLVPLEADIVLRAAGYALAPAMAATRICIVAADKGQTMRGAAALVMYELARSRGWRAPETRKAGIGGD